MYMLQSNFSASSEKSCELKITVLQQDIRNWDNTHTVVTFFFYVCIQPSITSVFHPLNPEINSAAAEHENANEACKLFLSLSHKGTQCKMSSQTTFMCIVHLRLCCCRRFYYFSQTTLKLVARNCLLPSLNSVLLSSLRTMRRPYYEYKTFRNWFLEVEKQLHFSSRQQQCTKVIDQSETGSARKIELRMNIHDCSLNGVHSWMVFLSAKLFRRRKKKISMECGCTRKAKKFFF